jgi:alginate O-acetyltransferase complex protein AlgI
VGIVAYTVQIYFDFSGYSDMAIGLALMLGFRLPENFNRPYSAYSITDFWRRWHISLSRWFRDYVYVPLGGNRHGNKATCRNLLLVFLLAGIWHGADWTFVVWGAYHGAWLIAERATNRDRVPTGVEALLRRGLTMLAVMVGWVFFRATDLGSALHYLRTMFMPSVDRLSGAALSAAHLTPTLALLAFALLVFALPRDLVVGRLIERRGLRSAEAVRFAVVFAAAPLATVLIAASTFRPFLYFQF